MDYLSWFLATLYIIASVALLSWGLNAYVLVFSYCRKLRSGALTPPEPLPENVEDAPKVTTQIAIYNEVNVAERVINAVAAIDYPKHCHQIQVVDDSNDETCEVINQAVAALKDDGYNIVICRRNDRVGYKGGALREANKTATGEFIAIFDSDFVPESDFLRRAIPAFTDENVAVVQGRWEHLNRDKSYLTKAQAIGIDGHFIVEQAARSSSGLFLNFNGTCGVWRKSLMEAAGGWHDDTLTEDLDLSYRVQLMGGRIVFLSDLAVPGELPESFSAFRSQQFRWAKGSIQTAKKNLPKLWMSSASLHKKFQATMHICGYMVSFFMLWVMILAFPIMQTIKANITIGWFLMIPIILGATGPSFLYFFSQRSLNRSNWWKRLPILPGVVILGFGLTISNSRGVIEAIIGKSSEFVRTPKSGEKTIKSYKTKLDWVPILEVFFAGWCFFSSIMLSIQGNFESIPILLIYGIGLSTLAMGTWKDQRASLA